MTVDDLDKVADLQEEINCVAERARQGALVEELFEAFRLSQFLTQSVRQIALQLALEAHR